MKALAFTSVALFRFSQFEIHEEWFDEYWLPEGVFDIRRICINDVVYFIENNLNRDDVPIIVMDLSGENPIFSKNRLNVNIFERIITVTRSILTNSVRIPNNWCSYHDKNLLSIYAYSRNKGSGARINIDAYPDDEKSLYIFAVTEEVVELQKITKNYILYKNIREELINAILDENSVSSHDNGRAGIFLSARLPQGFIQGSTLTQWYESKLTLEQRTFVDKPHDGPVRLRGAAGTGKTISLVIKLLRDAIFSEAKAKPVKFGFITHSMASVDLVSSIAENLDPVGFISGQGKNCQIEIRTLYDLAHQHLKFNLDELVPLSLDGRQGKRLQYELIGSIIKEMQKSSILKLQFNSAKLSQGIYNSWSNEINHNKFIYEIMNEFASILDAESIRAGEEKGERYACGSFHRAAWLMSLPCESDRRFILEIHRRYRNILSEMNTLSVDQMVADFNSFLDSNRWDSVRYKFGYDALFIDELHLFTSIERQTLHKLIKKSVDDEGRQIRPPIFMAYDLKQSPNDAFASSEGSGNIFSANSKLQNSDLVKLEKVFRYTPQIAEFLADLDASFPAIDIPDEWGAYSGKAELTDGDRPILKIFEDEISLFSSVMDDAKKIARVIQGGGRRVAVLCVSDYLFDEHFNAAKERHNNSIFAIDSRESSSELRHAGKRFVFSMPEYVAGLQFDTVFLLHVDAVDAPSDVSVGMRRQFISNVYLGASRAECKLIICCCRNRGGAASILDMAINRKSIEVA